MSETIRTMLIIEDQEGWSKRIKRYCQRVHRELYGTDGKIISASGYADAVRQLQTHPVIHFASIDLNLEEDDPDEKNPGGLQLLEEIQKREMETVSIVVSGETARRFLGISKARGVLTFQEKSKDDNNTFRQTYLTAVKAALLYVDAKEALYKGAYNEALQKWHEANAVVKPLQETDGGAEDWSFPVDIEKDRIKHLHLVSGLPTTRLINKELTALVNQKDPWWLFYIKIDNLDIFTNCQGSDATDGLIIATRNLIYDTFTEKGWPPRFFGQTSDNIFIVSCNTLSHTNQEVNELVKSVKEKFATSSLIHYDRRTRERGTLIYTDQNNEEKTVPLPSLSIGVIKEERTVSDRFEQSYTDVRELDNLAHNAVHSNQFIHNGKKINT